MSTLRNTLELGGRRDASSLAWRRAVGVAAFAAATAVGARLAIPLPGTPVPFTLQPLFVLLAGAVLGARLGAASQALYLAAGVAGLPVFAMGGGLAYLLGPTGGYLLAYPAAAFLAGALGRSGGVRALPGLLLALASIYAGGLAWLAAVGSVDAAVALGLRPFVLADLVKVLMVLLLMTRIRGRALRTFGS
ncbi:MAG TPA: biotin transporter BioY [Longimicrobiaceae bacterium]|nr:biotin transporter BioY [Longimicrobiaceae bacterium]